MPIASIDPPSPTLRPLAAEEMDQFLAYLNDHLLDNGRSGAVLFQPMSRKADGISKEKADTFRKGISIPVGEPGWRRLWLAINDSNGSIAGHIDLRAHPEAHTAHRALLGMGVERDSRRHGLGRRMIETVSLWAGENGLGWIDLCVLSGNKPARRLYEKTGFQFIGEIEDMFRIDGESQGHVMMARKILSSST